MLSLALVLSLLVSPHLVYHDLALLIVPLVTAAWLGIDAAILRRKDFALFVVGISILLLTSFIGTLSRFVAIYVLILLLLVYFTWPKHINLWILSLRKTNPYS